MLYCAKYYTKDNIVADICATDAPYLADPSGERDSTEALRAALNACSELGGGVVYLPAGRYLVTDTVTIPAGCVLEGDWEDPNTTDAPEYGTIILAKPAPLTAEQMGDRSASPLMSMEGRCGMIGLTFYYPNQSISNMKPYGYTIYSEAPRQAALRDITMINAYRGIGVGALGTRGHELMQNESIRICALDTAIEMYRSTEVGNTVDIDISPKYWIEAGCGFACDDGEALRDFCREHTMGIIIQQLDDEHLSTLRLDCCRTAIYLPRIKNPGQQGFWGLIYDIDIKDSMYGIVVEELSASIGAVIAKARIEASRKAIVNSSRASTLKLSVIELVGKGSVHSEGGSTMWDKDTDLSAYDIPYGKYQKPAPYLYTADIKALSATGEDVSSLIQKVLDEAAATGGVVYIPAGVYTVCSTLHVPAGVQLRGPTPVFVRDTSSGAPNGCVLLTYVRDGATIELQENAGVYGLRLFCPLFDTATAKKLLDAGDPVTATNVGIKGLGKGAYTYNVGVTATMNGIDFSGCDAHMIKQTFGCVYRDFATVGGRGGVVESCLNNPHFINRQNFAGLGYCNEKYVDPRAWDGLCNVDESGTRGVGFALLRDDVLRRYCTMVHVVDAEDEVINNIFMYAPYRLVSVTNSTAKLLNTSADFVGFGSVYHAEKGSDVVVINALRSAGDSIECDESSHLVLHNRINTEIYFEGSFDSANGREDTFDFAVSDKTYLAPEDSMEGVAAVELNTDKFYIKDGDYSYKHTARPDPEHPADILYEHHFAPLDISRYMNRDGYLHMWVYMKDMSTQLWGGNIQITSQDAPDNHAALWISTSYLTHDGWNEVWLSLADAKRYGGGAFDPTRVNYLRMHTAHNPKRNHGDVYIDDVYFCTAVSDKIRKPIEQSADVEATEPCCPITIKF